MRRKCNCSHGCGPEPRPLTRRDFLEVVGTGASALLIGQPAWAAFELPATELEQWRRELSGRGEPRRYLSSRHTDARMHLGGIGTGNFEIGSDGRFTTWQLFNTLRDGNVPFHFLLRAGDTTKLLQTTGGPDWPRVREIEMAGDYPLAKLQFRDPDLPVRVGLTAFTPFAPLDVAFSSLPLAVLVFRIENPTPQNQTVSLAAMMQNPVGYEANGDNETETGPWFGHNINEVFTQGAATGLVMRALAGKEPKLDKAVTLFTLPNLQQLKAPPPDRPANLKLEILDEQKFSPDKLSVPQQTVLWLEEPASTLSGAFLSAARDAVRVGATLVFAGKQMPLLSVYASWTGGQPVNAVSIRPDIVFEDFEDGYEKWQVQGTAFGKEPAHGTLPNQQPVSGFLGHGLVNSYLNGDGTTGRLISQPFTIERRFIRFLVGGGQHEQTQIRLLVDEKQVRATSGNDNERLEPAMWDVAEFAGRRGHIEIVDEQTGGWGHINIDQIVFSDLPGDSSLMLVLEELLPAHFSGVRPTAKNDRPGSIEFENLTLKSGASAAAALDGTQFVVHSLGKGKVAVVTGALLAPAEASVSARRQHAYAFLCSLAGAQYEAPQGQNPKAPGFGTVALATLGPNATVAPALPDLRSAWDGFQAAAHPGTPAGVSAFFTSPADATPAVATPSGRTVFGAVASRVEVPAGGSVEVPFLLAWHFPNKYNPPGNTWIGCHYATGQSDAAAIMREAVANLDRLRERTELFHKIFYDSSLPHWLLDCVTANAAIIRHIGVVFRIANGDVYGWEGSNGCCDPTCTHVWGYEQTLARLFPELEREMRRIDFTHQQRSDGGINNRTEVPSPPRPSGEQPFADGHASCILKAYREALNQPDDAFLKKYWPGAKRAVEYLIARDAKSNGGEPGGVLQDDQWNTYDEALHGVTTFISGYYLAALRAGEVWAHRMGESSTAERFHQIFDKGQKRLIELCWNGSYFQQHLPDYLNRQGEVGPGCMADQLIGQWWAHQLGLGYILPREMVESALHAIYKNNFKTDLTGWKHAPRAFAGPKDKGLIICTWPKGGRPASVMLYSDEVWTGIEYQVAAHMLYEGLLEEGLAIAKAARDRYDGIPRPPIQRNPWNEIECGGHYARAMSSWSLLLALSGWEYDGPQQTLRLRARHNPEKFSSFFAGPEGWGSVRQLREARSQQNEIHVAEGQFKLKELFLVAPPPWTKVEATCAGNAVPLKADWGTGLLHVTFQEAISVGGGETLAINISS